MKHTEEGTTQLIRRRIRHWKTTITGVALIVSPVAYAIWPEHSATITKAIGALTGAGFIAAADGAAADRQ